MHRIAPTRGADEIAADQGRDAAGVEVVGEMVQQHAIQVLAMPEVLAELVGEGRHSPTVPHQTRGASDSGDLGRRFRHDSTVHARVAGPLRRPVPGPSTPARRADSYAAAHGGSAGSMSNPQFVADAVELGRRGSVTPPWPVPL